MRDQYSYISVCLFKASATTSGEGHNAPPGPHTSCLWANICIMSLQKVNKWSILGAHWGSRAYKSADRLGVNGAISLYHWHEPLPPVLDRVMFHNRFLSPPCYSLGQLPSEDARRLRAGPVWYAAYNLFALLHF